MIADSEDFQESEASEIYVERFKDQEVFVQADYQFPCAKETVWLLGRLRPSSTAEGNLEREDDVEIEEGYKKGSNTEDS